MSPAPPQLRTARERGRAEMTRAVLGTARRQLGQYGAAGLSLRAVARELGVASSAVYRYVNSREELLTRLIVEAYEALGAAAEAGDTGPDPAARWLSVCRAVRRWALAHPHEFALIYGSPVPGYVAPEATLSPAGRVPMVMATVLVEAAAAGQLIAPPRRLPAPSVIADPVLEMLAGVEVDGDLVERSLLLWTALIGTLTFELFGHLHDVVTDPVAYFDRAMAVAAEAVGLVIALDETSG